MNTWHHDPITLRPVGFVQNEIHEPFLKAGEAGLESEKRIEAVKAQVRKIREMKSEIIIDPDLGGILDGLEEYSHLVILYWGHRVPEKSRSITRVHPMGRKDIPLTGIFSTCSPVRPNSVLTTVVQLVKRNGNILEVVGIDAINGSPVIDVKPYVRQWYPQEGIRISQWMRRLLAEIEEDGLSA